MVPAAKSGGTDNTNHFPLLSLFSWLVGSFESYPKMVQKDQNVSSFMISPYFHPIFIYLCVFFWAKTGTQKKIEVDISTFFSDPPPPLSGQMSTSLFFYLYGTLPLAVDQKKKKNLACS